MPEVNPEITGTGTLSGLLQVPITLSEEETREVASDFSAVA